MPKNKEKTFSSKAREWARKNGLHGPQAYLRYVFFIFLECLDKEKKDEFIFKGGNLLWLYIRTPRQTIDLDLVTRTAKTLPKVRDLLEGACTRAEGVRFKLKELKEVGEPGSKGVSATIRFDAEDGAANTFDIDIVYVVPTDSTLIPSPLPERPEIWAATLENIVVDKVAASHRFASGNTRMKDYDDLWRLAQSGKKLNLAQVKNRLAEVGIPMTMESRWINPETKELWKRHIGRYKELPAELSTVFDEINAWLSGKSSM